MKRIRPYILPILERHLADAAWLCFQFDMDRASFLVDFDRLRHYQRVFAAHLDGLTAAEAVGLQLGKDQLDTWNAPANLTILAYMALYKDDREFLNAAWDFLAAHAQPRFVDAAASAYLWLPDETAIPALQQLATVDDPLALRLFLSASGLRRTPCPLDPALFRHESPEVRAEVCRYAGRLRLFDAVPLLLRALSDEQPDVREQAAVALLLCNESTAALPELLNALQRAVQLVEADEGSASIRAETRAQHLARLLGHALPFPCDTTIQRLMDTLPPYVFLLTLAHHGNPAHIDLLPDFMPSSALYKRRALWAMSFILGINPENEQLLTDTPSLSADWPRAPGLDLDAGLPEPDAFRVQAWWKVHRDTYLAATAPLLAGQEMYSAAAQKLLAGGMQAQRFAAALHVCRLSSTAHWVDTRAPIALQRRFM